MAEHRPFPPSPRRRAVARQAGFHAASPVLVGAAAAGAALAAAVALAGSAADRLGAALAAACQQRAVLAPTALPSTVTALALPLAGAAALAAVLAHLAQTRALWLPRRRLPGAPAVAASAGPRTWRAAGELAAAAAIGVVAFAWLWWAAPRLAWLPAAPTAGARLLVQLGLAVAVAWLALGVLDAVARHVAAARALAMTAAEKREDDRLAGADPRWRARRAQLQRQPDTSAAATSAAVAGAAVVVLGDDTAVAIAWDPVRRPVPLRTATGRGPRATQLLGLARRHRIAVHRDPALAAALAALPTGDGPVPEADWPRLATLLAAVTGAAR